MVRNLSLVTLARKPSTLDKNLGDRAAVFLLRWVLRHVSPTTYGDVAGALALAASCLIAAAEVEIDPDHIIQAANGDLRGYMLRHMDRAMDFRLKSLAVKRR
jgi:hypothetical protein